MAKSFLEQKSDLDIQYNAELILLEQSRDAKVKQLLDGVVSLQSQIESTHVQFEADLKTMVDKYDVLHKDLDEKIKSNNGVGNGKV